MSAVIIKGIDTTTLDGKRYALQLKSLLTDDTIKKDDYFLASFYDGELLLVARLNRLGAEDWYRVSLKGETPAECLNKLLTDKIRKLYQFDTVQTFLPDEMALYYLTFSEEELTIQNKIEMLFLDLCTI